MKEPERSAGEGAKAIGEGGVTAGEEARTRWLERAGAGDGEGGDSVRMAAVAGDMRRHTTEPGGKNKACIEVRVVSRLTLLVLEIVSWLWA